MNLTRKDFMLAALATAGTLAAGCGDDTSSGGGGSGGSSSGGGSEGGASSGGAPEGGGAEGGAPAGGAPAGGSGEGGATGGAPAGGSGEGGGTPQLTCTETIGTNHGHSIEVSSGDVAAGVDKTYDIAGTSQHSHSVTITAAQFASLGNGEQVVITSTSGNQHTHEVTIVCV